MAVWKGFNPPFVSGRIVLPFQTDERLIKNDLLQLLLTAPGERVRRPDFGTNIRQFAFEPLTQQAIDALRRNIVEAVNKYEPRIKLTTVNIATDPDNNLATITILAQVIIGDRQQIELILEDF